MTSLYDYSDASDNDFEYLKDDRSFNRSKRKMHASAREPVNADFERLQNFSPNAILESYSDDEPEFMLALVHTERDLVQAEKRAADLRLKASCLRVRLLRLQSDRAARQLAEAELRVGRVNSSITRTGRHPYISVKTALDRYGNKRMRYNGDLAVKLD